jgi:nucleoside-diphosphate-sugar epimerase
MKVLVTGGAGFLGRHFVRTVVDQGHEARIVDLEPLEDNRFAEDPVEFYEADVTDPDAMMRATDNVDVVVHAAAALPIQSKKEIEKTDYDGTKITLNAAKKNNVDRFVYISTTAVYGIHDSPEPVPEEAPKDPVGPYGRAKQKAEQVCLDASDDLFVSILRPKTFVGPERLGIMGVLFDWIMRGKTVYILGDGTNRYQLLDVKDLSDAIWLACTHPEADSIFNVGATDYRTVNEDIQPVLDRADTGSTLRHLPARPIQFVLSILERLNLSPIVKWQYATVDKNLAVSPQKIQETLGWEPTYSNRESLLRNFEWYREHYETLSEQSGVTHRTPWNQKILKIVRYFS